jgi:ribosomal protein S18 acetylase RimI-like enzyme
MNGIEYLKWDSDFFKKKIGRVNCYDGIPKPIDINMEDYDLLYFFSPTELPKEWQPMLVDKRINTALINHKPTSYTIDSNIVEITEPSYTNELSKLLTLNGQFSRFYKDIKLRHKYDDLYQKWGKKCFQFETNRTWYYISHNQLAGFVTVDITKNNQVELSTVDPNFRGKGIGRKLWVNAIEEISKNGPQRIQITFQDNNTIAKNLYESLGFRPYEEWYIYHLWK